MLRTRGSDIARSDVILVVSVNLPSCGLPKKTHRIQMLRQYLAAKTPDVLPQYLAMPQCFPEAFVLIMMQQQPCKESRSIIIMSEGMKVDMLQLTREGLLRTAQESKDGRNVYWTDDPNVEMPIEVPKGPPPTYGCTPTTITNVFRNRVKETGPWLALQVTRNGKPMTWTYDEYYMDSRYFAAAMLELGISERSCVNIIGFNCPEWIIAFMGGIFRNMIACGVYTTNRPETCVYVADHSEAQIVVVDTEKQYRKYLKTKEKPKFVKYYIFMTPTVPATVEADNVLSWTEVMTMGKLCHEKHRGMIEALMDKQRPGQVCSYVYTSGTTSMPKACLLTHDAIISSPYTEIMAYQRFTKNFQGRDKVVSFLPLSHVAAFDMDVMVNLMLGSIIYFAQPDAMQGSLVKTLQEVRPTLILAVPRVYEKLQEGITNALAKGNALMRRLAKWAMSVGYEASLNQLKGKQNPFGFTLAKFLVLDKIKQKLGLDKVVLHMAGGGATQPATYEFFASLNIKISGLYGLTETAGPITYSLPQFTKLYASGRACYGAIVKIHNPDDKGEGEVCCRGRGLFVGYLKDAASSRQVFDEEGFYHTGDLGYIDADGYLYVTGRIKELLKTSGGENIAPLLIEGKFAELCPICSNMVVVGDKRKYLTALITLKGVPMAEAGKQSQQLAPETLTEIRKLGSTAKTAEEAGRCPKVLLYIEDCIKALNKHVISRAHQVKKWKILPRDFSLDEGEVTPTMKLKRYVIYKKYGDIIEGLYQTKPVPKLQSPHSPALWLSHATSQV